MRLRGNNVGFSIVVLLTLTIVFGLTAVEARRSAALARRGTECIIEQFAEHRAANEAAHRASAAKLDSAYLDSNLPVLPHIDDRLKAACAPFTGEQ